MSYSSSGKGWWSSSIVGKTVGGAFVQLFGPLPLSHSFFFLTPQCGLIMVNMAVPDTAEEGLDHAIGGIGALRKDKAKALLAKAKKRVANFR